MCISGFKCGWLHETVFFVVIRHTSKTVIGDSFSVPHYKYFGVISEDRHIFQLLHMSSKQAPPPPHCTVLMLNNKTNNYHLQSTGKIICVWRKN
jgi:hypothetical protein